ncbi:hypothetical protein RUM44_005818 [Polyplax serrata]|uniref:Uncharacterized protein n=1 Tax=Polyplax serrata TaxID=468196 RepID=A0ABR1AZN2_POLSC
MSNSIEERIKEFRGDPQKMDVATNFVNEVVEKAKNEALSRMNENDEVQEVKADCGKHSKKEKKMASEGQRLAHTYLGIILYLQYRNKGLKQQQSTCQTD